MTATTVPTRQRPRLVTQESLRSAGIITACGVAFLAAQAILLPMPLGVVLQGVIIGGLTALIAIGIALIYRANRIISFAQGDLGAVPTVFTVLLLSGVGVPFLVAVPIGLLSALAIGALVEFAIVRRFAKAPRLILTVATLGLAQALAGLGLILPVLLNNAWPNLFPEAGVSGRFQPPFDITFSVGTVLFNANDLIAIVAIVGSIVALSLFFRYTRIGIAVRASAESADRAMLLGIPVKRIGTIVWVIASALAFLSLFLRAGVLGLSLGSVLGPTILIRALAACVIGRMENLAVIFWSAVGLGILEQGVFWNTGRRTLVAPVIFAVILVVLLIQRRAKQTRTDEQSNWQAVADVRPVPPELSSLPEVRWGFRGLYLGLMALALLLPLVLTVSRINLASSILIYAMVAVSLVVLTGWGGQVSLGQIAFFGFGAAIGGAVTTRFGWDLTLALLIAAVCGAILAVIVGLPALRVRGLFLAVITLAFAEASAQYFLNRGYSDWWLPQGRVPRDELFGLIPIGTERQYYYFTLVCLLLVMLMVRQVRNSRVGRVIVGVRENERGAQAYAINLVRAKLTAFAFSGFIAAFAGAVFVHHQRAFGIQPYAAAESLTVFTMVVIGGLGSVPGAIVGALYVQGTQHFLPRELTFFASGIGLLLVLIALPGGLASLIYRGRDAYLRRVAERHRIMVPSLFADAADLDTIKSGREKGMEFVRQMADFMDASRAAAAQARAHRPVDAAEAPPDTIGPLPPSDDESLIHDPAAEPDDTPPGEPAPDEANERGGVR